MVLAATTACKRGAPPHEVTPPAGTAATGTRVERAGELADLPEGADADLYRAILRIADECAVDLVRPNVKCGHAAFDNLLRLFSRSPGQRQMVMLTASYAIARGDLTVTAVATHLLARAFQGAHGSVPRPPAVRKLLAQLATLPPAQAIELCPALAVSVGVHGLEEEFYEIVDALSDVRVQAACYEPLMQRSRLRSLGKIQELARSPKPDLALAAVSAPRVMGGRTEEENRQLCDWLAQLLTDERPMIAARAASFVATCGPKHLELLLREDEARAEGRRPPVAELSAYESLCSKGSQQPFGSPSKAQCARVRRLAESVAQNVAATEQDRVAAVKLLAQDFRAPELVALLTPIAQETELQLLSQRAQDVLRALERERPAAAR
ncbi:MAG: hypothetical protein QN159_10905 [Armatimonadota bacterium]|nr:hypothetical protein [Armatimonadota bacterium]